MTRALTPAERKEAARLEAQLAREGHAVTTRDDDRPRSRQGATKGEYFAQAQAFLEDHDWTGDTFGRECWELHADGVPNPTVAKRLTTYKKRVQQTVARLKALMLGVISGKRGRGRPRDPEGYDRHCVRLTVRLNAVETGALFHIEDAFRARGKAPPTRRDIVRIAIKTLARGV